MYRKRHKLPGSGATKTWANVNGEELTIVAYWDSSPPESDVDWPGSFEVTGVDIEKPGGRVGVAEQMTNEELEELKERLYKKLFADGEEDPRY